MTFEDWKWDLKGNRLGNGIRRPAGKSSQAKLLNYLVNFPRFLKSVQDYISANIFCCVTLILMMSSFLLLLQEIPDRAYVCMFILSIFIHMYYLTKFYTRFIHRRTVNMIHVLKCLILT